MGSTGSSRETVYVLKRPLEVCFSAIGLLVLLPLLTLAGALVQMTMGRPVFFRQTRPGLGGKPFVIYKFRTMRPGPGTDAGRLTGLGRFLRRFSVDELPELWNVVAGDLSLVGHRPEVPRYVDLEDPLWQRVLRERPGITHPVTLRLQHEERLVAEAGGDPERFYVDELLPFKLRGYIAYQGKRTFWQDVKVLLATAAAMVGWRWYSLVGLEEVRAAAAADEGAYD